MKKGDVYADLMRHMDFLCHAIGERHSGSQGEAAAASYIQEELESAGYAVEKHFFSSPGWRYGHFHLQTERTKREFSCFPCFYSRGGQACGKPIILNVNNYSRPITKEDFCGKIVIVHGSYGSSVDTNVLAADLDWAGASALIIVSPYQDTFSTKIVRCPELTQLIVLTVSENTAIEISSAVKDDQLIVNVQADNFNYQACNLVAIAQEAAKHKHTVMISAHYDTAPGIQGASDNASGVAIILTLAKKLQHFFAKVGVNVEIVAFAGEEYGSTTGCGYGATKYVNHYIATGKKKLEWMASIDSLGTYLGHTTPVVYSDRNLYRLLNEELTKLHIKTEYQRIDGCDVGPFNWHGIPTVFFRESKPGDGSRHFPLHSPKDCFTLIDPNKIFADAFLIEVCLKIMLLNTYSIS